MEGFKKLFEELRSKPWIWAVFIVLILLGVIGG